MTTKGNNMFTDAEKEGYNVKPKRVSLSEETKKKISLALKGHTPNNNERLFQGKSLAEWGRELGKSRERMRQLLNKYGTVHADEIDAIKAERKEARAKLLDQKFNDLLKRLTLGGSKECS